MRSIIILIVLVFVLVSCGPTDPTAPARDSEPTVREGSGIYVTELFALNEPGAVEARSSELPQLLRINCTEPDSRAVAAYSNGEPGTRYANGAGTNYVLKTAGTVIVTCSVDNEDFEWEYTIPFDDSEFAIEFFDVRTTSGLTYFRCSSVGGVGPINYEYLINGSVVASDRGSMGYGSARASESYLGSEATCRAIDSQGHVIEADMRIATEPEGERSVRVRPTAYGVYCDASTRPDSFVISASDAETGYRESTSPRWPGYVSFQHPFIARAQVTCTAIYDDEEVSDTRDVTYVRDASVLIYADTKDRYPNVFR